MYSLFGGRLGQLQVHDCIRSGGSRLKKTMDSNFVGECARKCDCENRDWWLSQSKSVDRW